MTSDIVSTNYWEYVTISYLICAFVLIGLILFILIDGIRQKKLLNELENQEKDIPVGNNYDSEFK